MKVCYALGSLNRGGAEMLALDVCKNITSHSSVHLQLLHRKTGDLQSEFKNTGIDITQIKPNSKFDVRYIFRLRAYIKKNRFDIIHTHQAIDTIYSFFSTFGLNTKTICTHHGFAYGATAKKVINMALKLAHVNVFVSKSCIALYEDLVKKKITKNVEVLFNGIDPDRLSKTKSDLKQELNIDKESILLGMTGNFYIDARDQLTICKAMELIVKQNNKVHFVFIGGRSEIEPEHFDKCYNFCESKGILQNVHFIGKRTDVSNILNELDLYVYSTNYETFGISVVEAMMSGLHCVINNIPPMLEISDNGRYCTIYESKNVEQLSEKILSILNNRNAEIKNSSREYALNKFGISSHISNLEELYKRTLKNIA